MERRNWGAAERKNLADQIADQTNVLVKNMDNRTPEQVTLAASVARMVADFVRYCEPNKQEQDYLLGVIAVVEAVLGGEDPPDNDPPRGPDEGSPTPSCGYELHERTQYVEYESLIEDEALVTIGGEEEMELWHLYSLTRTPEARNKLVEFYIPCVQRIARQLIKRVASCVEVEELASLGIVGLIEAIERFPSCMTVNRLPALRRVRFQTYSASRIRGAMIDGLRKLDWMPRRNRARATLLIDASNTYRMIKGHAPDDVWLMNTLSESGFGGNQDNVSRYEPKMHSIVRDANNSLDAFADYRNATPDFVVLCLDFWEAACRILKEKERRVIELYFGKSLTMREIAQTLSLTESRVSQLHKEGLKHLRKRFADLVDWTHDFEPARAPAIDPIIRVRCDRPLSIGLPSTTVWHLSLTSRETLPLIEKDVVSLPIWIADNI